MSQAQPRVTEESPGRTPALSDRFELQDYVGHGSFGAVWKVKDRWSGRVCAAKFLNGREEDREWRARFFHEYALLYRLRHPGLIPAYDYGKTQDGKPFFTMAWHDGPTLDAGDWSAEDRLRISWELLDTLSFLHRQELIHADIKANNIKFHPEALRRPLDPAGERALTLLDFGLTVDSELTEDHARRGTVHYMAPEWFKSGAIDHRIDLYSFGVLLFELYAGRPPFDGDDPMVVIRQHLESQAPELKGLVADVPSPVSEAVARLLSKQPEIRDKGWRILADYVTGHFDAPPGAGHAALKFHSESLGEYNRFAPPELLDVWLRGGSERLLLYVRGGLGLYQERVLESLVPDIYRYGVTPQIIHDPHDPALEAMMREPSQRAALIVVRPDTLADFTRFSRTWRGGTQGPQYLALCLDADLTPCQPLALELARLERDGCCHMLSVPPLGVVTMHRRLEQMLGRTVSSEQRDEMARRACGNPARLFALATDFVSKAPAEAPFGDAGPALQKVRAKEQEAVGAAYPPEERAAMSLLATTRESVDRSVLRALADISWSSALARWLDLGLVRSEEGQFTWIRPDMADAIVGTLTERRRHIVHRAWTEYWSSFSPEPGSDAHENLVYHSLRSDAFRRAVRAGLESARYWTGKHQAHRALTILGDVATCLAAVEHPAPSLVFEQAIALAETRRVLARYAEAVEDLQAALKHPAIAGQLRWEAQIYKRIGDLCKSLKQPDEGKEALEEALARYRQLADKVEISHVLNNIGNILYVAGDLDLAQSTYEEALTLQRELKLRREIASTLNNIGGLLVLRSQYDLATRRLTEAVEIKRSLNDPEELARSLNNLAVAYVETGKFARASDVLAESYDINVRAGKTGEQLFNLENMALVAMARGEWAHAMERCETGLRLCDVADAKESRLPYLLVMSGVALAQGNYELVPQTLGEADRILAGVEDPDLELQRVTFAAEWSYWRGQSAETLELAGQIIDRGQEERLPTWTTRGYLLRARGAMLAETVDPKLQRWLEKSLDIALEIGALPEQIRSRVLLAERLIDQNDLEVAAEHLRNCEALLLESAAKPLFLPFSHALGCYYEKRRDREMALSIFETTRKLATNLTSPEWTWRLLARCGHLLVDLRRYDEAVTQYRGALEILDHLVGQLQPEDRGAYMQGKEKIELERGLRACHEALVHA